MLKINNLAYNSKKINNLPSVCPDLLVWYIGVAAPQKFSDSQTFENK